MATRRSVLVIDAELGARPDLLLGGDADDATELLAAADLASAVRLAVGRKLVAVLFDGAALEANAAALDELHRVAPEATRLLVVRPDEIAAAGAALDRGQIDRLLVRTDAIAAVRSALTRAVLLGEERHLAAAARSALHLLAELDTGSPQALTSGAAALRSLADAMAAHAGALAPKVSEVQKTSAARATGERHPERRFIRLPLVVDVRIEHAGAVDVGVSENFSAGGLFVATELLCAVGERLGLSFRLPSSAAPIACKAEVMWQRRATPRGERAGLGLRFVELQREVGEAIEALARAWDDEGDAQLERLAR